MDKFDLMTKRDVIFEELINRGFEEDSWHGKKGLFNFFWSEDRAYCTRVYVFTDSIYFYKEYECGGMVAEWEATFDDRDPMTVVREEFNSWDFE